MYLQCTVLYMYGGRLPILILHAAEGGPSHEGHQEKKGLAPILPPKMNKSQDLRERVEKGLSKLLRLITLSCLLVLAASSPALTEAARPKELKLL